MANLDEAIAVDPDWNIASPTDDDYQSETTSIASSTYKGFIENGRRYQTTREDRYWIPADEQQFESLEAGHAVAIILDSDRPNALFQAPVSQPKHILDIGTGNGLWAINVAETYPEATVRGVDLFPPPVSYVPPNCFLEVDDILHDWTWSKPFDFIHLRLMLGSFGSDEWKAVYTKCYENLKPGGWIEQLELDVHIESNDGNLPKDSMASTWGDNISSCAERADRRIDIVNTMRASIEEVGFVDVHERSYKWPIGAWPKEKPLKEAGALNYHMWSSGIEGWAMWFLTKFGAPTPWSREEVLTYVDKIRTELKDPNLHGYQRARRVWARKPPGDTKT